MFVHLFGDKGNTFGSSGHVNRTILIISQKFIVQRGKPKPITSDNAPRLKLVKNTIDQCWQVYITDKKTYDFYHLKTSAGVASFSMHHGWEDSMKD